VGTSLKILALDTATEACSAAVLSGEEIIERYEFAPRRHATLIMPMIAALMAETGLTTAQLDALAFGRGPGAFTGIRIATAMVQSIAFAADLPVVPISTLAALARGTMYEYGVSRVASAIDARREEIYWGTYLVTSDGGVAIIGQERVCRPAAVVLADSGEWFGAGSGWAVYAETLNRSLSIKGWYDDCYPRARDIALLGLLAYQRGEFVSADQALPVYLRDEVTQEAIIARG
jgi:tRNA threonylcarbamoyladenosine biosynthesis protein TsaB